MARLIYIKYLIVPFLFLILTDTFAQNTNQLFYTAKDSVLINKDLNIYVSKQEYNEIIDKCPEFFEDHFSSPDQMYDSKPSSLEFGSEVGQDSYYLFYAHFLQKKYREEDYSELRENLSSIYSDLNYIFKELNQGGTFYGHMGARIPAYVEYSVYLYHLTNKDFIVNYDINTQKKIFTNLLKQIIFDRLNHGENIHANSKKYLQKKLIDQVDRIEKRIVNSFYLAQTHMFYVENYIFW